MIVTGVPPATRASTHRWVYHEGIEAYGLSFAKSIDEWGLAGEASILMNIQELSTAMQHAAPVKVVLSLKRRSTV